MRLRYWLIVTLILLLTSACIGLQRPAVDLDDPATLIVSQEPIETADEAAPTAEPDITVAPTVAQGTLEPADETPLAVETVGPDCLGDEISPIGQAIVEDYEFTSYEEVMTWFCNGADFEDILVALETEDQTGTPAEEMLEMLADDFTWEEIWQLIGLTD